MFQQKKRIVWIAAGIVVALILFLAFKPDITKNHSAASKSNGTESSNNSISVTDQQAKNVRVEAAALHDFVFQQNAVGFVDFNQDTTVQVFPNFSGKVRNVFVQAGEEVVKGQKLYSIDSPDLVQALSTLISTAGVRTTATRNLDRAKKMLSIQATAQKDYDQAVSDQQTAEGNYQAARDAVRIFGLTDTEMDKVIASRKPNAEHIMTSPIAGKVVARNAAPGMMIQLGSSSSPVTVADTSTMWLIANVTESDIPNIRLKQPVSVSITALPGEKFQGVVTSIGSSVDPNTRRIPIRSEIKDSKHQLRQQMLATYVIQTGEPVHSIAIPANGIVREGDGTMTIFVTTDEKTFTRRAVRTGQQQQGLIQVLEGLSDGEKVATDGAIFLSNAIQLQAR